MLQIVSTLLPLPTSANLFFLSRGSTAAAADNLKQANFVASVGHKTLAAIYSDREKIASKQRSCDFFLWYDPEPSERSKIIINEFKKNNNKLKLDISELKKCTSYESRVEYKDVMDDGNNNHVIMQLSDEISLFDRVLDYDEKVRKQVVAVVYDVACHSFKLTLKKYTMERLVDLHQLYCLKSSDSSTNLDDCKWITGKKILFESSSTSSFPPHCTSPAQELKLLGKRELGLIMRNYREIIKEGTWMD
ncbi:hypothetical protein ZIOFF_029089 [Zingiber officinale]|uniref:Uncharacterized protein n=1 Tax=Zingiber officinale TaxID=94328 RepID=A0A8J5GNZ6_ZINOF|nr:hypothetical protein ZIOFF_029089 [Zingiber officinale]